MVSRHSFGSWQLIVKAFVVVGILAGHLLMMASPSRANNIYIAQSATGAATGADCADALATSWFNSSSNWGSGANQIGPGTTVHLCGTITGAAGTNGLTFQGGGSSGNPVTLLFETGAAMNSPQWGVAISSTGNSYITIDGGSNGLIQNTANGSTLTYQNSSCGVCITGGSNIEARNLTITNIYVHNGTASDGEGTSGIYFAPGNLSNVSVHNNTVHDAQNGIFFAYCGLNGANIYGNTTFNHRWGIALLDNDVGCSATNVTVHDNVVHDFANWFDTAFAFHFDGIFFAATNSNTSFTNSSIYNNYVYGTFNTNGTGFIYLTGTSGGLSGIDIYNNLLVPTSVPPGVPGEGNIVLGFGPKNVSIYNNTLVGSEGVKIRDSGASGITIENNVFLANWMAIELDPSNSISVSNYNDFDLSGPSAGHLFYCLGNWVATLAQWQSSCGQDSKSVTAAPNLDSNYHPLTGSAAIGLGSNLTALGIGSLDTDKSGTARPKSGSWDGGAYQSGSTAVLAPPTGLTAVVQ